MEAPSRSVSASEATWQNDLSLDYPYTATSHEKLMQMATDQT